MFLGTPQLFVMVAIVAVGTAVAGEPPVRLSDDGSAILYRSQPGDSPGAVAERFGVHDLPAFLAANGITDPTRVAAGHVYQIANPLAERAVAAEARVAALSGEVESWRSRVRALEAESATLTARADDLERRSAALVQLARLWPWVQILGIVLVLGIGVAGYVAYRSVGALGRAETYARQLADEVDERRRAALAERQESARRILRLEEELRSREHDLARMAHPRPTGTH